MRIPGVIAVLTTGCVLVDCAQPSTNGSSQSELQSATFDEAASADKKSLVTTGEEFDNIAGSYYRGDGTGFNLHLDIVDDGRFSCVWRGCLGVYGNCAGTWQREGDIIHIAVTSVEGMFERRPLSDLEILALKGKPILIQLNDRDFFDKWGPSRFSCFASIGNELGF